MRCVERQINKERPFLVSLDEVDRLLRATPGDRALIDYSRRFDGIEASSIAELELPQDRLHLSELQPDRGHDRARERHPPYDFRWRE